jgi:hypothetical protein
MSSLNESNGLSIPDLWTPEERRFKGRLAAGTALLEHVIGTEDFEEARRQVAAAITNPDVRSFLATLVTHLQELEATQTVTVKGTALFMKHGNRLLGDITPLEACVVDEYDLALEAARCFADSERGFDSDLAGARVEETAQLVQKYGQ